ncbi:MAG: prepilin-type N-terminal cleavage/methylation domain-containing protein [bacterium]|nr:prepilin-type N-terminal cleavage/methylation domain-containing protein [bacterium]
MKNNKGFTLTELLVTIVIIGVLSSVGIVSITKLRKNQEIKFNNSQLQVFKQAAQTYFTDNKEKLPLDFGEERVYLKELITNNYIDKLLDYNKKPYDENNSYVDVMRVFDKYIYIASLVIGGKDGEIIDDNSTTGSILIKMLSKPNCTGKKDNKFRENCPSDFEMKNIKEYYTNTNVKMQIDLEDDNKLFAYNYTIYKNNNSIYTSEYIRANDNTKYSDIITMNTDRYSDGIYKVEIKGINKEGQILTKTTKPIYIDLTRPTAPVITGGNAKKWKNYSQIIWTTEESTSLSGIMKYQRCKQVNKNDKCNWEDLNVDGGGVEDEQGKTVKGLDVAYYHSSNPNLIEKFKGNTKKLSDYYDKNGKVGGKGDKWLRTAQNYSEEGNYIVRFRAVNKAGTNGVASSAQRLMIDKTSPKCQVSGESKKWTDKDRNLIFKCSDNGSGCETEPQTKTIKTSMKTIEYSDKYNNAVKVKDKAGNITKCESSINTKNSFEFSVYVDKGPTAPEITGGSNNWKNYAQIIWTTKKSTSLSGIQKYQYCYTPEESAKNCKWNDLNVNGADVTVKGLDVAYYHSNNTDLINEFKGKTKNLSEHYKNYGQGEGRKKSDKDWLRTAQNFGEEGSYNVFFRAINNLGTLSKASNKQTLKIDMTAPTIPTISNPSNGERVCENVVINASSSDSSSGIKQISYSYDNSKWQTDWNEKIDNNDKTSVSGTWSSKRNNTVHIRACDNAGNCSFSATTTVHIGENKKSPVCGQETSTSCEDKKIWDSIPANTEGYCKGTNMTIYYGGHTWTLTGNSGDCHRHGITQSCCEAYRVEKKCSTTTTDKTCCLD